MAHGSLVNNPGPSRNPGRNNNAQEVIQEVIKFDLAEALKKMFPEASEEFLRQEISRFFRDGRNVDEDGWPIDEPEMLAQLTESLLRKEIPKETGKGASKRNLPRVSGIRVLPQTSDVVEVTLREELVQTLAVSQAE